MQYFLCTVDENWPHLLIRPNSKMAGIALTSEKIQALRNNGINTLLKLPNGSIVMPNSGVMGNSFHVDTFDHNRFEEEYIAIIYSQIQ